MTKDAMGIEIAELSFESDFSVNSVHLVQETKWRKPALTAEDLHPLKFLLSDSLSKDA